MKKHLSIIFICFFFSISASTQNQFVEVRNEPRHHLVFENKFIRLLDVHLGPGDSTMWHRHNTPSVFIYLSNTQTGSRLINREPTYNKNVMGKINYDPLGEQRIHQVWNADTSWMHVIDAELMSTSQMVEKNLLSGNNLKTLFQQQQVNGYLLNLEADQYVNLPGTVNGMLLISTTPSDVHLSSRKGTEFRKLKEGHYHWIGSKEKMQIKNSSRAAAEFLLLQF